VTNTKMATMAATMKKKTTNEEAMAGLSCS
jgi:hypothetical protein